MASDLDSARIDQDPTFLLWRECPTLLWLRVARARSEESLDRVQTSTLPRTPQ